MKCKWAETWVGRPQVRVLHNAIMHNAIRKPCLLPRLTKPNKATPTQYLSITYTTVPNLLGHPLQCIAEPSFGEKVEFLKEQNHLKSMDKYSYISNCTSGCNGLYRKYEYFSSINLRKECACGKIVYTTSCACLASLACWLHLNLPQLKGPAFYGKWLNAHEQKRVFSLRVPI